MKAAAGRVVSGNKGLPLPATVGVASVPQSLLDFDSVSLIIKCSTNHHFKTCTLLARCHRRGASLDACVVCVDAAISESVSLVKMARAHVIVCAFVALGLVATSSAITPRFDLGASWTPTPDWFAKFMSQGGMPWTGAEDVPVMRQKFFKRMLDWGINEITDSKHDVRARLVVECSRPLTQFIVAVSGRP